MRSLIIRIVLTVLVAVHLEIARRHGLAHEALGIPLSTFQRLFIDFVIVSCPIVACIGLWGRFTRFSLWLLFGAMLSSLVFGVYFHYVFPSPDNVMCLPAGISQVHRQFTSTAALLTGLQGGMAVTSLVQQLTSSKNP